MNLIPKIEYPKDNPHSYLLDGKLHYSPNGASEISGYSEHHIQKLCVDGKIQATRVLGFWYISDEVVQELKRRKEQK